MEVSEMIAEFQQRRAAGYAEESRDWFAHNDESDIPDAEYHYPDCPICGQEVEGDESLYCSVCDVVWNLDGTHGERIPEDER